MDNTQKRNFKKDNMNNLYIENYSNTEFISEEDVYAYLENLSYFLKDYNIFNLWNTFNMEFDTNGFIRFWYNYLQDIINEVFNNFLYGNFLSATAMTRSLMETFIYLKVIIKEQKENLLTDWFYCCMVKKIEKQMRKKEGSPKHLIAVVEKYCEMLGDDYDEIYKKFSGWENNENSWLKRVISEKKITFHTVCIYAGESEVYDDFGLTSSFVHGQDLITKMSSFTFYSSIYMKLFLMSRYIFKVFRLFKIEDDMELRIQELEQELMELAETYME